MRFCCPNYDYLEFEMAHARHPSDNAIGIKIVDAKPRYPEIEKLLFVWFPDLSEFMHAVDRELVLSKRKLTKRPYKYYDPNYKPLEATQRVRLPRADNEERVRLPKDQDRVRLPKDPERLRLPKATTDEPRAKLRRS